MAGEAQVVTALSGGLAGLITAICISPLDIAKTRLQLMNSTHHQSMGLIGVLSQVVRTEGARGLYRGLSPALLALLPNWAIYFTVYDKAKQKLSKASNNPNPFFTNMAAACAAGAATLTVTNPLWVVRTRLQTQTMQLANNIPRTTYTGAVNALRRIAREEGMRGLYSGLLPSYLGLLHVAVQFPSYEALKTYMAQQSGVQECELQPIQVMMASSASKVLASTVSYPHEVMRSNLHVAQGRLSLLQVCRTIMARDGIRGFYRGCGANMLRTVPSAAITFTTFELVARHLRRIGKVHQEKLKNMESPPAGAQQDPNVCHNEVALVGQTRDTKQEAQH